MTQSTTHSPASAPGIGLSAPSPVLHEWERPQRHGLSLEERRVIFPLLDLMLIGTAAGVFLLPARWGIGTVALVTGLLMAGLLVVDFYQSARGWSVWQVMFEASKGLTLGGLLAVLATLLLPAFDLGWALLGTTVLAAWLLVTGWRLGGFKAFAAPSARGVVILGADAAGIEVAQELRRHPDAGYQVLGFVDDDPEKQYMAFAGVPVLGPSAKLPGLFDTLPVEVIVMSSTNLADRLHLIDCVEKGASILTFPAIYEQLTLRIPLPYLDIGWFIYELKNGNRKLYLLSKRIVDVVLASLGLAATALVTPLIALAIKLSGGPGPVLYSQSRVGYMGREFKIYKFRTMCQNAEHSGAVWAAQHDARVTPIGKLLRQSRLDELPQFWNVMKGEMSLVGPRPERPEFVAMLEQDIPFFSRRHMVSPGITGWAQVMFPYGASVEDAREKLQFDLYYIKNRSFYLDLKIMLKTIGVMIQKIGSR